MPREKEPSEKSAELAAKDVSASDSMSLVDLFDQRERDAFRRSLAYRDGNQSRPDGE